MSIKITTALKNQHVSAAEKKKVTNT